MAIRIEAAQEADLPALSSLWRDKMLLANPARAANCKSKMARMISLLADGHSARLLVAREDSAIVGYIAAYLAETVVVEDLTLDMHRHCAEAGRLLVDAVIAWAVDGGHHHLIVHLYRPSAVERAFWIALQAKRISAPEQRLEAYCLTF